MTVKDPRPTTIILDLDGCVFKHGGTLYTQGMSLVPTVLPGVHEKFAEWDAKGYNIIILTGRRESMREVTIKQLEIAGLYYDQLIMGIGGGTRVLINDLKDDKKERIRYRTALAVEIERNEGLTGVDV